MANKPQKPCKEIGCRNLTRKTYCENHEKTGEKNDRGKFGRYNQYGIDQAAERFYKSSQWQRLRRLAFERDNGLCKMCLSNEQLVPANVGHHLVEVKTDWSQRLVLENIQSLCHPCHNRLHKGSPGV